MIKKIFILLILSLVFLFIASCDRNDPDKPTVYLQLVNAKVGTNTLDLDETIDDIPVNEDLTIRFSNILDTTTLRSNIELLKNGGTRIETGISMTDENKIIILTPVNSLEYFTSYTLKLSDGLRGLNGEVFPGLEYTFLTVKGILSINNISINNQDFITDVIPDVDNEDVTIEINFSDELNPENYETFFILSGTSGLDISLSEENKKVTIVNQENLKGYTRYFFTISSNLTSADGHEFEGFTNSFYTSLDSTPKFPSISDEDLLELVQKQTFKYFYDFGHPVSGMTRERNTSGETVTSGGSGFGVMAIIVGVERGFITRAEGISHMQKMLDFLENADRFHGAWSHWLNGTTGEARPFGTKDNGGDLVETSFMVQGLLTLRQYLNESDPGEKEMIDQINEIWEAVEWDWYTRGTDNALYWHWSPDYNWDMNMQVGGYNEALITHILATSSPTYRVDSMVYHTGWAKNGGIINRNTYYDITLPVGYSYGGPLFFTHYSFLGLDPTNLQDRYANYWEQNVNHSLINWSYCVDNPKNYIGYNETSWGLTASDNHEGYSAHSPTNDLGVITPTAAISSIPYTPEKSMDAIRHFYYILGDKLWGEYGFYDAFNVTEGWWASSYIAIDQGPIIVMIENYRSGLLWNLFMSCPEVQAGLTKLGFNY